MSDTKTNETAAKAPSMIAYQVRDREGRKSFWTRIGSAWAFKTATDSTSSSNACRSTAASRSESHRTRRSNSLAGAGTDARSGFSNFHRKDTDHDQADTTTARAGTHSRPMGLRHGLHRSA